MKKILVLIITLFLLSTMALAQQGNNDSGLGDSEPGMNPETANEPKLTGLDVNNESEDHMAGLGQGDGDMLMNQTQTQTQLKDGSGDGLKNGSGDGIKNGAGEQLKVQNQEKLQTGLETAMSQVKNENAKQMLQKNMEQFQQKYESKLQNMKDLEITEVDEETGAVKIKAKEEVKFLGFIKGNAVKTYDMDAEGNIVEKKPWFRFMYKESSE